ncbi:hypothetical protein KR093_011384, partial [Drosophila rubida]
QYSVNRRSMRCTIILCGFFLLFTDQAVSGSFKINKISCKCLDTNFCAFSKCEMNVLRRGVSAFNMRCEIYKKPITNIKVHFELFRKSNGYRSFLLNHTLDYCFYMRSPTSYPLFHAIHKTFITFSNFNHSCPYDHDFVVNNFVYGGNSFLEDIPLPNGEYMLVVRTAFWKAWRMEYKIHVLRTD